MVLDQEPVQDLEAETVHRVPILAGVTDVEREAGPAAGVAYGQVERGVQLSQPTDLRVRDEGEWTEL